MTDPEPDNLLFFDGVCGLCNRTVDFILKRDDRGEFSFSPLQGKTAEDFLSPGDIADANTLVLKTPRGIYRRSSAVVRILWLLGGVWKLLGTLLWIVPLPLRNLGYRIVAATRYRIFGKKSECRIPTPEERARFLP